MKKKSSKIIYVLLILFLLVVSIVDILDDYTGIKKLRMLESDSIKVINLKNDVEMEVKYSALLGENRGESFYSANQLGIDLKEWRREYKLIFYKDNKKIQASIYTIDVDNQERHYNKEMNATHEGNTIDDFKPFKKFKGRYGVVKLDGLIFDNYIYTKLDQDFYDNLMKLDL